MGELVGTHPDALESHAPRFTPDELTQDAERIAGRLNGGVVVAPSVVLQPLSPGEWIASFVPGATPPDSGVIDMADEHALGGAAFSLPITRDTEPKTRFQDGLLAAAGFAERTQGDILLVVDIPNDKVVTLETVDTPDSPVLESGPPVQAADTDTAGEPRQKNRRKRASEDLTPGVESDVAAEPMVTPKRRTKKNKDAEIDVEAANRMKPNQLRHAENLADFTGIIGGKRYYKGVLQNKPDSRSGKGKRITNKS